MSRPIKRLRKIVTGSPPPSAGGALNTGGYNI